MNHKISRDASSGRLLGVCVDLAERTGIPLLLVRILALAALLAAFKLTVIAYCAAAIIVRVTRE